jgi:hypothetical protein
MKRKNYHIPRITLQVAFTVGYFLVCVHLYGQIKEKALCC